MTCDIDLEDEQLLGKRRKLQTHDDRGNILA